MTYSMTFWLTHVLARVLADVRLGIPQALRWLVPAGVLLLSACQTMQPPAVDTVRFVPAPPAKRNIAEPKVKYLVRTDGYEYCARITGIPITPTSRPMACAFWNTRRKECSIITPEQTGYNYLGHELRHCFEGSFHD